MKFFQKRSQKSGYSNISEPISDLDPKRISAIKSKHVSELDPKVISAIKAQHIDAAKIQPEKCGTDATVSLTPSPSLSSKSVLKLWIAKDGSPFDMQSAGTPAGFTASETVTTCSPDKATSPQSSIQKQLFGPKSDADNVSLSPTAPKTPSGKDGPPIETANEQYTAPAPPPITPKTPDTFFQGKNRKRIVNGEFSDISTEHSNIVRSGDQDQNDFANDEFGAKEPQQEGNAKVQAHEAGLKHATTKDERKSLPAFEWKPNPLQKCTSTSSDLDKTFSPEIISVSSDITEPSYNLHSSKRANRNPRWTWNRIRDDFQNTCRQHDHLKAPLSFLDKILDSLCPGPSR
jgi:hypothetical protein